MALQGAVSLLLIFGFAGCGPTTDGRTEAPHSALDLQANPAAKPPICGKPDDGQIHIPPDWGEFTPPPVGKSFVDPVFGCPVKRLTNSSVEERLPDGTYLSFMHYYSTFTPISADDSMVLIASINGAWRIKDINGKLVVPSAKMPAMNNGLPLWDASDASTFYYTLGKALHKGKIIRDSVKSEVIYKFDEYTNIVSPAAADLSQDGEHLALVGQNRNNTLDVFLWSLRGQNKASVYTTTCKINGSVAETPEPGCVHKLQLTPDNSLVIQFAEDGTGAEQGLRLWKGGELEHLQDRTNHLDTGYDLSGKAVFIGIGNSYVISGEKNPCPSKWGLDVRQLNETSSALCLLDRQPSLHVSYRGSASQPWAAISFFDDRKPGPELFGNNPNTQTPTLKNWKLYEDEIMLARIDGGEVYRLAHARSRSAENYWGQPHAAISRDGKYIVFSSNMAYPDGCPANMHAANECTDVYFIRVH